MGFLQSITPLLRLHGGFSPGRGDAFLSPDHNIAERSTNSDSPSRGVDVTDPLQVKRCRWGGSKDRLYLSLVILLIGAVTCFSQEKKEKKHYIRIIAGPVLSFYQNNKFHTSDSKPRYAFVGGIFEDVKLHKGFSFMPGLEYAYHGLTFNSYYLAPGYQFLYDGHYDYNYRLTFQEFRANLLVKQVIGIESRNAVTGYTACGYVLRYLYRSNMLVTSNLTGAELFSGKPDVVFEHPLFRNNMASAVKFIAGAQRNFFNTHRAFFFEACLTFSLSRFYVTNSFAPSSLFINGSFLQLGLGVKL